MEDLGQDRPLRFDGRVLTLAKDADYPEENQDAFRADGPRGAAAIADGVSSSLFARSWAEILVEAAIAGLPDHDDRESLARWLADLRAAWARQIDVSRLAWFQKPKLRDGAFSTLLCVRLVLPGEGPREGGQSWRLQGLAIGDSCLFLVRDGQLVRKFPIQAAAELEGDPVVLGSVDLNRDELLRFHRLDEPCQSDDLVVLCTDAIADWALRLEESGNPPAWETYWDKDASAWKDEILALRAERAMRCDDATLGLLRVTDEALSAGAPALCAGSPALCAGLPTPHTERPQVSSDEGDLRSSDRRGQETCAERDDTCAERDRDENYAEHESVSPVPPVPPPALPEPDIVQKIVGLSERATEGLARGVVRGVERLKKAGQAARSKLKDYLDHLREDDR